MSGLGSTEEGEDQHYNKDESDAPARVVSPTGTVRPSGKHA